MTYCHYKEIKGLINKVMKDLDILVYQNYQMSQHYSSQGFVCVCVSVCVCIMGTNTHTSTNIWPDICLSTRQERQKYQRGKHRLQLWPWLFRINSKHLFCSINHKYWFSVIWLVASLYLCYSSWYTVMQHTHTHCHRLIKANWMHKSNAY